MNTMLLWLLGLGIFLIVHVYLLYPIILWLVGRIYPRGVLRNESLQPPVAIVFCAYNEEAVIADKVWNSLVLDYPRDRFQIVVASDSSTDRTDEIVQSLATQGVRVVFYRSQSRLGKTALLNQVVPLASADILVFTDANSLYEPNAIKKLIRNFADPRIGYVTGRSRYIDAVTSPAADSESLYWRYEDFLKREESRVGSMVGADGAIYAIRRELYWPLQAGDANDFVNPLQIVREGWRGVYEPEAICWEATSGHFEGEFRRKVRIVTGCLCGLARVPAVLNPFRTGWFALQVISHKLLRWLIPFFLLQILVCSGWLVWRSWHPLYILLLSAQFVFYLFAFIGWLQSAHAKSARIFYLPYYFCLINTAALLGVFNFLRGKEAATWDPQRSRVRGSVLGS